MADKKVERNMRSSEEERPAAPTHALTSTAGQGPQNPKQQPNTDAKTALLERFREREERLRQEDETAAQTEAAPAFEAAPAAEAAPNSDAASEMETEPEEEALQE